MEWKHDSEVQDLLKEYLVNQKHDLGNLLDSLGRFNDGSPPFQFLKVYGMFVWKYCDLLKDNTEADALELSIASIVHDPIVQNMVATVLRSQIDRGVGL